MPRAADNGLVLKVVQTMNVGVLSVTVIAVGTANSATEVCKKKTYHTKSI